jgi:HD-GYP domain-containing protein (c-di-GMP phosphodiesterase class II)
MAIWDILGNLFPETLVNIESNDTNINIVKNGGDNSATNIRESEEGTDVIDINLDALSQREQREFMSEVRDEWNDDGELILDERSQDKRAIERTIEDEDINSTLSFFDEILPERYYGMLKASLFLRKAWEGDETYIPPDEVQQRKTEIAEEYGREAYNVSNLCTAGYFDEEGYI